MGILPENAIREREEASNVDFLFFPGNEEERVSDTMKLESRGKGHVKLVSPCFASHSDTDSF